MGQQAATGTSGSHLGAVGILLFALGDCEKTDCDSRIKMVSPKHFMTSKTDESRKADFNRSNE